MSAPNIPLHKTEQERDAARASDPMVSAWVSANAGAGKTHLLANRVTRLLLDGAEPSKILCLTYTKAAAAEMSRRLFDRLGAWALLQEKELAEQLLSIGAGPRDAADLKRARTLFAQALETPGGLKIQTLHSFCQHVLTRFPIEAGVAPRFQVLDDRSAQELMRGARNDVLERAGSGSDESLPKAVAILATRTADARFGEIVDLAIGQTRGKLRNVLARHGNDTEQLFAALRRTLNIEPGLDEPDVVAGFCRDVAGERGQCERVARWLLAGAATDKKHGAYITDFLKADFHPDAFEDFRSVFLVEAGTPRKTMATKNTLAADPVLAAYLDVLAARVLAMDERRKAAATATLTESIVTVAVAVLSAYDRAKRSRASLDYDDLIARTMALLDQEEAAAWVLYKLDGGLDHILVDEAQDTSPEQWRIVTSLVEEFFAGKGVRGEQPRPRTIFAVGDEKQSIFSFQGADPAQFGGNLIAFKTRAEDAKLAFEDVRPPTSRRSAVAILDFVDAVFAAPNAHDGLTAAGGPPRHEALRTDIGRVEIWPTVKPPSKDDNDPWAPVDAPSSSGAHAVLAAQIADRIAGWLREGIFLPSRNRAIAPGDIMILVRRRNAFAQEMIRQLVLRNVAVAGADRMQLAEHIAIADLVALGRFALLPEDDLNLAALLKSPIAGLDEDQLFDLAHNRKTTLWQALSDRKTERPEFTQAHATLADALAHADYTAPFEFYARILNAGARKRLTARLGSEALDAIDEFLALALAHEGTHAPSLQSFLDWFARGADEVKRDMDEGGAAVRVMTVHGAKGLEADIVFVPDTAQAPNMETSAGLLYTDDMVFFGVPKILETAPLTDAKQAAHARELREYRRLLYVALTRARDWLIVCGFETQKGVHADSWYPLTAEAARMPGKGREEKSEDGRTILAWGENFSAAAPATAAAAKKPEAEKDHPAFLSAPAPIEPVRPRILRPSEAVSGDLGSAPPVLSPLTDSKTERFARGLHLHALLAALPNIAHSEREATALRYASRRNLTPVEGAMLAKEAMAVLDHPEFGVLFGKDSGAEIAVVADLPELGPGIRVSGQIDRLAVTSDTVWIADFKTNRPPPQTEEATPALYRAQMALYRAALAKLYPTHRIACALIWTEGPRLMRLSDASLDRELAQITSRFVG